MGMMGGIFGGGGNSGSGSMQMGNINELNSTMSNMLGSLGIRIPPPPQQPQRPLPPSSRRRTPTPPCPATWTGAAAPLIGEEDFGAIIVERGRVPIGEFLIQNRVDAHRLVRIRDIENHAIARTRSGGNLLVRKHCDVVAMIRA